jgi:hypothetical protein
MVDHLPTKHKAPNSNSSTTKPEQKLYYDVEIVLQGLKRTIGSKLMCLSCAAGCGDYDQQARCRCGFSGEQEHCKCMERPAIDSGYKKLLKDPNIDQNLKPYQVSSVIGFRWEMDKNERKTHKIVK